MTDQSVAEADAAAGSPLTFESFLRGGLWTVIGVSALALLAWIYGYAFEFLITKHFGIPADFIQVSRATLVSYLSFGYLPPLILLAALIGYLKGRNPNQKEVPSATNGAVPAWLFVAGGRYFGVDAVTGQLLGSAPV